MVPSPSLIRADQDLENLVVISVEQEEAVRPGTQDHLDLGQPLAPALAILVGEREDVLEFLQNVENAIRSCLAAQKSLTFQLLHIQERRSTAEFPQPTLFVSSSQGSQPENAAVWSRTRRRQS